GAWLLQASFPAAPRRGGMRLGFGLVAWQTASVHGVDGRTVRRAATPGLPSIEAQLHQVSESDGEAQLTLLARYPMRDWQMKVVAINRRGEESVTVSSRGSPGREGQAGVWSYRFWRLPLSEVKEFRVMMRPIHWIEFRDLPLLPDDLNALGRSARPLVPTAWSAEKEVHIAEYFDFDKGITGAFPTAPDGTRTDRNTHRNPAWAREQGFDVEALTNALRVERMLIIDLRSSDWDTLSIPEFEKRMNVHYGPPVLPAGKDATLPLTHGFKTAQGAMGLMQITGLDAGAAGVRLRYKLIERAHFQQP
ncbi:MAG TPA: hypothetical protein VNO52_14435, partial [Methylomirabilota bacterium]|nr:hypothetical protein [Methylomirabilota bacterium]